MRQSEEIKPVGDGEKKVAGTQTAPPFGSEDSSHDGEKQGPLAETPELKRKLKARHLQMIAIGMW